MANGSKPWAESDMQRVAELYPTMKAADVARAMGRSISSVRAVAYRLGLKSESFSRWSESDNDFIMTNWGVLTPDEIALHLGRTKTSVQSHASILGITKKNPIWTQDEDDLLEELWGVKTIPQIAKIMGRSEWSITIRANRMGLGAFKDYGEYIPAYRVSRMLGVDMRKITKNWIPKCGLKSRRIAPSGTKKFTYIRFSHLLDWLRKNPDKWDSRQIKLFDLGLEPNWLKEKRKADACLSDRSRQKWTPQEDESLTNMLKSRKYTHQQIGDRLGRSVAAVEHRVKRLNKINLKGMINNGQTDRLGQRQSVLPKML